jgi:hypothetical protein
LYLCMNANAMHIIRKNPDKINWRWLSRNPNAMDLLEKNQDKINWIEFWFNPGIFTYDYEEMRHSRHDLKQEIIKKALHPTRIMQWLENGMDIDDL